MLSRVIQQGQLGTNREQELKLSFLLVILYHSPKPAQELYDTQIQANYLREDY